MHTCRQHSICSLWWKYVRSELR